MIFWKAMILTAFGRYHFIVGLFIGSYYLHSLGGCKLFSLYSYVFPEACF